MRLAKALTLLAAALLWLIVALAVLFATFPLWGMTADGSPPGWMIAAVLVWFAAYVALAIWIIRLKKFP